MSEYGAMKPLQRAQLKQSDPKRFERIRAEHEHQERVLRFSLGQAKSHEEYKARRAELELFASGGNPFAANEESSPRLRTLAEGDAARANKFRGGGDAA